MKQNEFGNYLCELRKSHNMTQRELANYIKKTDMFISGMETGKNGPPKEKDLLKIVEALELDPEETWRLKCKAAFSRGTLPDNLLKLIKKDSRVLNILCALKNTKKLDESYDEIMNILSDGGGVQDV